MDSGQASFFDFDSYPENPHNDVEFYDMVCEWTLATEGNELVDGKPGFGSFGGNEHGVASSSGFGDGGYDCYVDRDREGMVVAAEISFIVQEDEDEEEGPLPESIGADGSIAI